MSELHAMLVAFEKDLVVAASGRAAGDLRARAVMSTVARRRRVRAAAVGVAATIGVLAFSGAAWALAGLSGDAPVASTPSPTQANELSPVVTSPLTHAPSPEVTMPAFTGTVTVDPHLPSAVPITAEAWNQAGPGWVLATYREEWLSLDSASDTYVSAVGPQVAYLISPQGVRYQLGEFESTPGIAIVAWKPQDSEALAIASTGYEAADKQWVIVDLVDGGTRAVAQEDIDRSSWTTDIFLGSSDLGGPDDADRDAIAGGEVLKDLVAGPRSQRATVPTAAHEAALDTARALAPAGLECADSVQLRTQVAVICGSEPPAETGTGLWYPYAVVFVDDAGYGRGTVVDLRSGDDEWPTTVDVGTTNPRLGDALLSVGGSGNPTSCPDGWYIVSDGGAQALPGPASLKQQYPEANIFMPAGEVGTNVYTLVSGGCSGEATPNTLVVDDVAAGTFTVLVPWPADTLDADIQTWVSSSLLSAYVVPADD